MRTTIVFLAAIAAMACDDVPDAEPQAEPVPQLSVAQVASMLNAGDLLAVDANNAQTRERHGTLPDATLLTSSSEYDVSELPSDQSANLVFYCANTRCTASDGAAERAREAGYANVHVMREGITGWKEAGNETQPAS